MKTRNNWLIVFALALALICPRPAAAYSQENLDRLHYAIYENLAERQTHFSVKYPDDFREIFSGSKPAQKLLAPVYEMQQSSNFDDYDYLKLNVKSTQIEASSVNKDTTFTFRVEYLENRQQLDYVNQWLFSVVPEMRGANDYETIKNIHDYIVNNFEYDKSLSIHTAYGAITSGKMVCQGYTALAYKMLNMAGVPCRIVKGKSKGENHAWNLVKLDGDWYHLDVTWDDPVSDRPILSHKYFLVGSQSIDKDHTLDDEYLSSDFQYYQRVSEADYPRPRLERIAPSRQFTPLAGVPDAEKNPPPQGKSEKKDDDRLKRNEDALLALVKEVFKPLLIELSRTFNRFMLDTFGIEPQI